MANVLDKRDMSLVPRANGHEDKIARYKWARPGTPGEMQMINKNLLNVDDRYQRSATSIESVRRIAREWDWSLFGVLKVAQRPDGSLWVFDGGHRTRASFYHSEIQELPCIVFKLSDIADEARVFIAGAKMSKAISSLDTFRAASVAREPDACRTAEILNELGIVVKKTANNANEVKCIGTIQSCVAENDKLARECLIACQQIAGDQPILASLFRGLFGLAQHFNGRDILRQFSDTINRWTQQEVEKAIRELKAMTGKGGSVIEAKAIMGLLNKGKRTNKLEW